MNYFNKHIREKRKPNKGGALFLDTDFLEDKEINWY